MGFEGVYLFFVLSGFLLTVQTQDQVLGVRTVGVFYARRLLRIFPAVWLQLMVLALVGELWSAWTLAPTRENWLINALLWVNMPPAMQKPAVGVWWTLPVELSFYALLPVSTAGAWVCCGNRLIVASLVITGMWRWDITQYFPGANFSSLSHLIDSLPAALTSFLAGAVAARWNKSLNATLRRPVLWFGLLGFFAVQALLLPGIEHYWQGGWLLVSWNTLLSVSFAAIELSCVRDGSCGWLNQPVMQWLGERSFGLYLWDVPAIEAVKLSWPQADGQRLGGMFLGGAGNSVGRRNQFPNR